MSYIITDDKHYKDIAKSIRSKMQTDREYYPKDMAIAVDNIPSSADGTDNPITGIYFLNPNNNGYPTKIKVAGFELDNKETNFPLIFTDNIFKYIEDVEFINCDFKYFQNSIFYNCSSLTTINLPDGITSISSSAFYGCSSLSTVNLPDSLISISNNAFYGCSSLTTVNLPDGITSISSYAFRDCQSLTKINLPSSLTSIGSVFYQGTTNLTEVTLGDNFNCNNLDLSASDKIERETAVNMFIALADRTGLTAYTLTLNKAVANKLTDEDKAIPTAKNWTIVYK